MRLRRPIAVLAAVVLAFALGYATRRGGEQPAPAPAAAPQPVLADAVRQVLAERYVRALDPGALASARTVPQLIAQLRDPFTSYLTSAQYAALQGRHGAGLLRRRRARARAGHGALRIVGVDAALARRARRAARGRHAARRVDGAARARAHRHRPGRPAGAAPRAAAPVMQRTGGEAHVVSRAPRRSSAQPAVHSQRRRGGAVRVIRITRFSHGVAADVRRARARRAGRRARPARQPGRPDLRGRSTPVDVFLERGRILSYSGRAHVARVGQAPAIRAAAACRSSSWSTAPPPAPPRSWPRPCATTSAPRSSARARSARPRSRPSSRCAGGGAVKLTVADVPHAQRPRPARPRRAPRRAGEDAAAGARGRRGTPAACVTDEQGGPRLVACTVERRGRFLVAQPLLRRGPAARARAALRAGRERGRARGRRARGRQRARRRAARLARRRRRTCCARCCSQRGLAGEWPEAALREARRARRASASRGRASATICSSSRRSRSTRRPRATSTTRSASSPTATAIRALVHIADVASYVKPGGALDAEAARRTCSVYVPGSVEPMLPLELSADACSLRPGEVRRVVSIEVRIGADGKPGAPHVRRALIRSRARLTYDEAHEVLAGAPATIRSGDLLARADALARDLRARRHARGAFALGSRELSFEIDDGRVVERPLGRGAARARARRGAHAARERGGRRPARASPAPGALPRPRASAARGAAGARRSPDGARPAGRRRSPSARTAGRPRAPWRARPSCSSRSCASGRRPARPSARCSCARSSSRATTRSTAGHAALSSPAYVHFTSPDPALSRHRRAPRGLRAGRTRRGGAEGARAARGRAALLAARARGGRRRAARRCDLPGLPAAGIACGATAGTSPSRASSRVSSAPGCSCASATSSRASCPARRLDPRERFDSDEHGVALVGRSSGRRIRLGDELSCVVTAVDPPRGRATLDLLPENEAPRPRIARRSRSTTPRRPPKPPRSARSQAHART